MENFEKIEDYLQNNKGKQSENSYEDFGGDEKNLMYDEIYEEGWNAFQQNKNISDNPYEEETDEWQWWRDGFKDAEQDFFNNDYQV